MKKHLILNLIILLFTFGIAHTQSNTTATTLIVNSMEELKGINPVSANSLVFMRGYYKPNDGGGGWFYFDSGQSETPNGGTIVEAPQHNGVWIRECGNKLNVKWFGAKGDGKADDINAIQAAINAVPRLKDFATNKEVIDFVGGTVFFPLGHYKITRPILMINDGFSTRFLVSNTKPNGQVIPETIEVHHNFRKNITLEGILAGPSSNNGCKIIWSGPDDLPMLKLHSTNCNVKNITFQVDNSYKALAGIELNNPVVLPSANGKYGADGSGQHSSNCSFDYVQMFGTAKRGFDYGVLVAPPKIYDSLQVYSFTNNTNPIYTSSSYSIQYFRDGFTPNPAQSVEYDAIFNLVRHPNVEYMYFRKCVMNGMEKSTVYFANNSGQQKHFTFMDCSFIASNLGIDLKTGSFQTYSCTFGNLDVAIHLQSPYDNIVINDTDLESTPQFLTTGGPGGGNIPILINGGRFALDTLVPNRPFIENKLNGPLTIQSCTFGGSVFNNDFKIYCRGASGAGVLLLQGNAFPNIDPLKIVGHMPPNRFIMLGNKGIKEKTVGLYFPVLDDIFLNKQVNVNDGPPSGIEPAELKVFD